MDIITPIIIIIVGISMITFPTQLGVGFCKLGKTIWKLSTLGLTDMRWFYQEDKAPIIFRRLGVVSILVGVIFSVITIVSFFGPNSFAAMREVRQYLEEKYGQSETSWSLSCQSKDNSENSVHVYYRNDEVEGCLIGVWNGSKYLFTEEVEKSNKTINADFEKSGLSSKQ